MVKTQVAFEENIRERKDKLIRKPTWEELTIRGLEAMEKEQAGFNLEQSK